MSDRTARWLLILLLLAQVFLVTLQVAGDDPHRTALEGSALRLVAPLARAVVGVESGLATVGQRLRRASRLREENATLRRELDALRGELTRRSGIESDLQRLREGVTWARRADLPLQVADVVYADHRSWLQALVIHAGEGRAEPNQPVVAADGLVGRVVLTAGGYAKVQLVTDRAAAVGAMVERTRRQGIVRGTGAGLLELDFVPRQADVRVGDRVVTAGIDGVYPRGLSVGEVTSVQPGGALFHHIEMRPSVDTGTLDHVYLLPAEQLPTELREAGRGGG